MLKSYSNVVKGEVDFCVIGFDEEVGNNESLPVFSIKLPNSTFMNLISTGEKVFYAFIERDDYQDYLNMLEDSFDEKEISLPLFKLENDTQVPFYAYTSVLQANTAGLLIEETKNDAVGYVLVKLYRECYDVFKRYLCSDDDDRDGEIEFFSDDEWVPINDKITGNKFYIKRIGEGVISGAYTDVYAVCSTDESSCDESEDGVRIMFEDKQNGCIKVLPSKNKASFFKMTENKREFMENNLKADDLAKDYISINTISESGDIMATVVFDFNNSFSIGISTPKGLEFKRAAKIAKDFCNIYCLIKMAE